jgi:hypothetical protein
MDIRTIYETLHDLGYTSSQVEFSKDWLGRSTRYYSHLIACAQEPGLGTLVALEWRIRMRLQSEPRLATTLEALRKHIDTRAIVGLPKHPTRPHAPYLKVNLAS